MLETAFPYPQAREVGRHLSRLPRAEAEKDWRTPLFLEATTRYLRDGVYEAHHVLWVEPGQIEEDWASTAEGIIDSLAEKGPIFEAAFLVLGLSPSDLSGSSLSCSLVEARGSGDRPTEEAISSFLDRYSNLEYPEFLQALVEVGRVLVKAKSPNLRLP